MASLKKQMMDLSMYECPGKCGNPPHGDGGKCYECVTSDLAEARRVLGVALPLVESAIDSICTIANAEECDLDPQMCDHTDDCFVAIAIEAHDQLVKARAALTPTDDTEESGVDQPREDK